MSTLRKVFSALMASVGAFAVVSSLMQSPTAMAAVPTSWSVEITPSATLTTVKVTTSFSGLLPTSAIQLKLMPNSLVVADGFSSADGLAVFTFGIPSSLSAGDYIISATGVTNTNSAFSADVAAFSVAPNGLVSDSTLRDGPLSLEVAADAAASFASPYLEGNISVTEGVLGRFSVRDDRIVSKPGWTLYASVADFVLATDATKVIPSNQLGVTPLKFAPESTAQGVELGTSTRAGASSFPMIFAQASPGATPGITVLDASLKLLSPPYLPVGTYNSTVTLTLVSK